MIRVKFLPSNACTVGGLVLALAMLRAGPAHAAEQMTGERDFAVHCAICHGLNGKGGGPFADKLRRVPKDLTLLRAKNRGVFPDHLVYEIIDGRRLVAFHGTREMPIWGDAFRAHGDELAARRRISALVEYLRSRQAE